MPEIIRPVELPKIEKPGDYAEFCMELTTISFTLAREDKQKLAELQASTLELLNRSFDVHGLATIQSELAYAVVVANDNYKINPLKYETRWACYEIGKGNFTTSGYCFGFQKNEMLPSKDISLVFADGEDPFQRKIYDDPENAPLSYCTYFVPITSPHKLNLVDGLSLAA